MSANENEKETNDKSKGNNSIHENEESVNRDENENKINNGEEEGEEKEGNDGAQEEERQPFWYFGEINKEIIDQSIFEKGKYKYCICLLMKDESKNSSLLLYKTIKGISLNLNKLEEEIDIK